MKKFLALILAILILCLAACGEDKVEDTTNAAETTSSESTGEATTQSPTAESTTEETPSNDLGGMYVFTADEASAAALGEKYSWFPEYGVKFVLVLTLGETEKAVLDLHLSSIEEIEEALFKKTNCESAEANGMSYDDFYAMILEQMGSEEAIRENFRNTHTGVLPEIQSNLIDAYPMSGTYRADGESVTVTLGGGEMTFVLDGENLVTERNGCAITFLRQG